MSDVVLGTDDQTQEEALTREEALDLTARIKSTHAQLWRLLLEAHDRKAWEALGYETWKEYVTKEALRHEAWARGLLTVM